MSSSREQPSKSARSKQKEIVEQDLQTFSDDTTVPSQQEANSDALELKGPPRRPAIQTPPPQAPEPEEATVSPTTPTPDPPDIPDELAGQQPIPPPSEPMQYRAIGLVKGRYQPSEEQFNRGELVTEDGTHLDAVLLGQVMSLVKKYLDLEQTYLWVVYPRTREKEETLHIQVVGVWSAEGFGPMAADGNGESEHPSQLAAPLHDGYFSVRGEIVFHSPEKNYLLVKIQQSPRKTSDRPKAFKLKLLGTLTDKTLGYFWDLHVQREGGELTVLNGQKVALVPPKKRSKRDSRQGSRRPKKMNQYDKPSSKPRSVSKPIKKRSSPEA